MLNKKWFNKNIFFMGCASLFSDFGHEMANAILPAFIVSLGGSAAVLGIIEGFADLAASVTKIFSGWYSDYKEKRKPLIVAGYLLTALGVGMFTFSTKWLHIFFAKITIWLGKGLRKPARDALIVDSISSQHFYGRAFGFHRMMDTIGAILGPALAFILIAHFSLHTIFCIAFFPEFIAFLIVLLFIKEMGNRIKTQRSQLFESVLHLPRSFIIFISAVFVFGIGNFAMSMLILRSIELLTPKFGVIAANSISVVNYMSYNLMYAFCSYPMGYLSDIWGKKKVLAIGYIVIALVYICFTLQITNFIYITLLFIFAGFSRAIVSGGERAIAAELLPEKFRGTGFGVLSLTQGIGDFISSIIVGFLWTNISVSCGFYYAAILCAIGGLILIFTNKKLTN